MGEPETTPVEPAPAALVEATERIERARTELVAERNDPAAVSDELERVVALAASTAVAPEVEAAQKAKLDAEANRERITRLKRSGLCLSKADLARIVNGTCVESPALVHVRRWLAEKHAPLWLVLCGGVGCGKTVAAGWAIDALKGGVAVSAPALGRRMMPWVQERRDGIETLDLEQFIVLDDLGTEHDPREPRFAEALLRFIDERFDFRTIITTNLQRTEVRKRYGDRVADRLNQIASAVQLTNPSYRAAKKGDGL